jgi:hypothetical protein
MASPDPGLLVVTGDMRGQRRPGLDRRVARLAADQHGVVAVDQLRRLGLTLAAIQYRVTAGRLHRVHRGVYAVGHAELSNEGRWLAAVLAAGAGAALSHTSAAMLWGFWPPGRDGRGTIEVSLVRRLRQRPGMRLYPGRALAQADVTRRLQIPVTTPARTLIDLAATECSDRRLERAIHEAEVQRRVSHAALHRQLERSRGRHGAPRVAAAIDSGPAPTRSEFEDRTLELICLHGLPRPLVNEEVPDVVGRPEVDFLFPSVTGRGGRWRALPRHRVPAEIRCPQAGATRSRRLSRAAADLGAGHRPPAGDGRTPAAGPWRLIPLARRYRRYARTTTSNCRSAARTPPQPPRETRPSPPRSVPAISSSGERPSGRRPDFMPK